MNARDILIGGMKEHMADLRMQAEEGNAKDRKVPALVLACYYSCLFCPARMDGVRVSRFIAAFNLWFNTTIRSKAEDPKKVVHPPFIADLELAIMANTPRVHLESLNDA